MTDDPEPTTTGHWEVFAPVVEAEGTGRDHAGSLGAEINYGLVTDVQVTLGLSGGFAHNAGRTRWGTRDLEASIKYRFYHDEARGFQVAAFPGISLPTGSNRMSVGSVTALLPVWAQADFGPWSIFGGGGYAINPGQRSKDYWTGGAAVVRQFSQRVTVGIEADRNGPDEVGGRGTTSLGLGTIYDLPGPLRLLARAARPCMTGAALAFTPSWRWDWTTDGMAARGE